jgi:hypothetical protein
MASRKAGDGVTRAFWPRRSTLSSMTAAALFAAPLMLFAWLFPPQLLLPAFAVVAIVAAMATAAWAHVRGPVRGGERITAWDVAGGLAFIGFAAAMFGDPDPVAGFFSATALAP